MNERLIGCVMHPGPAGEIAVQLARELELVDLDATDPAPGLRLVAAAALELHWLPAAADRAPAGPHRLWVDLQGRRGGGPSLVARAVGLERGVVEVLDATAGLGRDSADLARRGACVTMVERHPVLAALLADGLRRLTIEAPELAARFTLLHGDAHDLLTGAGAAAIQPESVLIDPMFEDRGKRAAPRMDMQICRRLLGHGDDEQELRPLLVAACAACRRRVAVKRPPRAPALGAPHPPVATVRGKRARFDVYAPAGGRGNQT